MSAKLAEEAVKLGVGYGGRERVGLVPMIHGAGTQFSDHLSWRHRSGRPELRGE